MGFWKNFPEFCLLNTVSGADIPEAALGRLGGTGIVEGLLQGMNLSGVMAVLMGKCWAS
jgi:hypothetical protein